LKRVEDATDVRRRLLTAFEQAEATDDDNERRSLLNFLIVGGADPPGSSWPGQSPSWRASAWTRISVISIRHRRA
jgi:hypothetical protein